MLLSIEGLTVTFRTEEGPVTAVEDASLEIREGEVVGLVGESGSGKSVLARSVMQLNPRNARYGAGGRILFHGPSGPVDVLALERAEDLRVVRGGSVSMIFQEPMASFAPAISIGSQMVEQLRLHTDVSAKRAREIAVEMLDRVGISDPSRRFDQYAFELSGGMRQRAMIAMALSTRPRLLIADEPTTALDVTIQAQVLDLMSELVAELGMAVLLITHDLGVVAGIADRIAVMYLGRIVEAGPVRAAVRSPAHPYTRGLFAAIPRLDDLDRPLMPVPGDIPSPLERPAGCPFHTRCAVVVGPVCRERVPARLAVGPGHGAACHRLAVADPA
ncbi:ABC transporter ATP-binding protein [Prosthecomicrobium sp. N25]|uniref:ABC transporter ATP-binding protein n=1 Tax=Prosthecomicrobium sp. N25 TaxID=3129254 RepID=UPI003077E5E6